MAGETRNQEEQVQVRHMAGVRRAARWAAVGAVLAAIAVTAWPQTNYAQGSAQAMTVLRNAAGEIIGNVVLVQQGGAVRVEVQASGLTPGFHGFHVHAAGMCDAAGGFTSAGGHFNPGGATHGSHGGDLPSLYVMADGTASMTVLTDGFTVADLFDDNGSAIVVHAGPDNFANIPTRYAPAPDQTTLDTGDAGGRVACGVVTLAGRG